jgi:hypothetical protein
MYAAFTRIEPQHHFAEAEKVPAAVVFGFYGKTHLSVAQTSVCDLDRGHPVRLSASAKMIVTLFFKD